MTVVSAGPYASYLLLAADSLQCFDAVGWAAGKASGLKLEW